MTVTAHALEGVSTQASETSTLENPATIHPLFGKKAIDLRYYHMLETELNGIPLVLSRTGWSGELGFEIYLEDRNYGDQLWERVMEAGKPYDIKPAAPNTIRSIEGGLLSYVSDITLNDNPFVDPALNGEQVLEPSDDGTRVLDDQRREVTGR